MGKVNFAEFLKDPANILVLDGALGTELESRGCDLSDPLWSGRALIREPHVVREVEEDYYRCGARCVITATYQSTPQAFMQQLDLTEGEALRLTTAAVELACQARQNVLQGSTPCTDGQDLKVSGPLFVAGSVGPYGAYLADGSEYRCKYRLAAEEFKAFHRPRLAALVAAGVDVLAIETMPSADEVRAVVQMLTEEFPQACAWVSFSMSLDKPHTHIADGSALADIVPLLNASEQIVAVGVNCVPLEGVTNTLEFLATLTTKPLVAYPNSSDTYDVAAQTWKSPTHGTSPTLADCCPAWLKAGARLIGGCCRTGPLDIQQLHRKLIDCQSKEQKEDIIM